MTPSATPLLWRLLDGGNRSSWLGACCAERLVERLSVGRSRTGRPTTRACLCGVRTELLLAALRGRPKAKLGVLQEPSGRFVYSEPAQFLSPTDNSMARNRLVGLGDQASNHLVARPYRPRNSRSCVASARRRERLSLHSVCTPSAKEGSNGTASIAMIGMWEKRCAHALLPFLPKLRGGDIRNSWSLSSGCYRGAGRQLQSFRCRNHSGSAKNGAGQLLASGWRVNTQQPSSVRREAQLDFSLEHRSIACRLAQDRGWVR